MKLQKSLLFMVMIISSHFVFSQKQTFTGTVTDAKTAEPISGVSVKVKGKAAGTMTAQNGSFSISAQPGDVLEISFVGFKTESVKLTSETKIAVALTLG